MICNVSYANLRQLLVQVFKAWIRKCFLNSENLRWKSCTAGTSRGLMTSLVRRCCRPLYIFLCYYIFKSKTNMHQHKSALRRLHNFFINQIHQGAYRFVILFRFFKQHLLLPRYPICFMSQWTLIAPYIWYSDKFRGHIVPQKGPPLKREMRKRIMLQIAEL